MRVSERLGTKIWASALIVALAWINAPTQTTAQVADNTTSAPADTVQKWLGNARDAMTSKNWELAEYYIQIADDLAQGQSVAEMPYTPEMARQELAMLRGDAASDDSTSAAPEPLPLDPTTADMTAAAKNAMLKARQNIAVGQIESAVQMVNYASGLNADWASIGDSPSTIQALIAKQNELSQMRAEGSNASYNGQAAAFLLQQASTLLAYGDYQTAEVLVKQASRFPVEFTPEIGNPDQMLALIEAAKAKSVQQASSATVETTTSPKAEVMKLLSMAQLAMDQGNWGRAKTLVNQAKEYQVPDSQFGPEEMRPWQMDLRIQQALNLQRSTAEAQAQLNNAANIRQTNFEEDAASMVVTAEYNPDADDTRNMQVSGSVAVKDSEEPVSNAEPMPTRGMQLYRSGLQAMDNADKERAREYFEMAWRYKDDMDAETRQAIQDHLSNLTVIQASHTQENAFNAPQEVQTPPAPRRIRDGQQAAFSELQSRVFRERATAERMLETSPRQALEKMTEIRSTIAQSELDQATRAPLLRIIDRDIDEMQRYMDQNLPEIMNDEANAENRAKVERLRQDRLDMETQIQKLVEDFNRLVDEQRWMEAEAVARQARDLDPNSEAVVLLTEKAQFLVRTMRNREIYRAKERGVWEALEDVDKDSIPLDGDAPYNFGNTEEYAKKAAQRLKRLGLGQYDSEMERRIWNLLRNEQVQGEYRGTLAEAVDQLSRQAGVNIIFDMVALGAENVQIDRTVDVPIRNPISLQSALNVILGSAGLVFVVEDEVIKVTSRAAQRSNVEPETYYVGDLVTPITNFDSNSQMNFMNPNQAYQGRAYGNQLTKAPLTVPQQQQPEYLSPVSLATNSVAAHRQAMGQNLPGGGFGQGGFGQGGLLGNGYGGGPTQYGAPGGQYNTVGPNRLGGITEADFDPLIDLIKSTIAPDDWDDTNGDGTIQPFVSNLSLIVSQTQEVQDQIQDLLKRLRELNDVQIVIEVRFIVLQDNFFERVGIDFDFRINDNSGLTGIIPDEVPRSTVIGRDPDIVNGVLNPTSDFDIGFRQDSFSSAVPQFGGFDLNTAANFGFAILSDIEVFFLIQASKGDLRSNIMQAPTVTMFNGQSATVTDGSQRPFVTSVTPVVGDFAVAHQPVITILPDGTSLNVQAVVSYDRRFVRMTLVPYFSQVTSVETFTFAGSTTTRRSSDSLLNDLLDTIDGGDGGDGGEDEGQDFETVNEGVTIQLPVLAQTSVSTVVSVPDGGTVLMGGIKRMAESRTERGVPFLSNLPYVNRLFKNVGIGRETSNLMMMVTPRIIIQEEEEINQVGPIGN